MEHKSIGIGTLVGAIVGVVVVGFLGLSVVFGSWYTVDQGERAVVTRNGKVVDEAGPGFNFKLPMIEAVTKFEVRTTKLSFDKIAAYSKDTQTTYIKMSLNYHLAPDQVRNIYSTLGTSFQSRVIEPNTLRAVKDVFGKWAASDIINNRDKLGVDITSDLTQSLSKYGIVVEIVQLENIDFSDTYEKSIEARMTAEVAVKRKEQELRSAEVDAQTAQAVAQGSALAVKAEADGEAYRVKVQADADAYKIIALAKAQQEAIQKQGDALKGNPLFIELTKANKWDGKFPTTMPPNSTMPFLNLSTPKD